MPRRLFGAARAHSGHGQPAKKLATQMRGKLVDSGALRFPERLVSVIGLRPRRVAIFLRQPIAEDRVSPPGDCEDSAIVRSSLSSLRENTERLPAFLLKLVTAVGLVGAHPAAKDGPRFP